MGRRPENTRQKRNPTTDHGQGRQCRRQSNAERSAYFARREAAKVLRCVLQGDARRRAVASIKTLVYGPSVRNKKATFALVCQTLKYLPILKDVLEAAKVLNGKWKRHEELVYIIMYDILFGQAITLAGDAERFLLLRKDDLQAALAQLCVRKKVKCFADLLLQDDKSFVADASKPRYARVNTLKLDTDSALHVLGKQYEVRKDDVVPNLLVLPPGTDLHAHPLVNDGGIFLQGKASSMVAVALSPEPGWEVLDACSAPGNKTVHLAALMSGKGKIIACELNKDRVKLLEETIKRSGASSILLKTIPLANKTISKILFELCSQLISGRRHTIKTIRAILLDPSCSGSGTAAERLDHLLPSNRLAQASDAADNQRAKNLAAFQSKALAHALSFPSVERVVYSTCSVHQTENEDVIKSVLPLAASLNFQLETPFPQWPRRGLPVFVGSEHLLRTDPVEDMEGFFIALFVKKEKKVTNDIAREGKEKNRNETKTTVEQKELDGSRELCSFEKRLLDGSSRGLRFQMNWEGLHESLSL
ncbi:hypothetical protein Scep_024894 [Stephania cephalantha]|uniref:SAM-dependent MTase RsmB/NOP-type domain-containing protein n=1 Tax=Stephania cephalantha TaxID=152367 RepID=A0AAP0EY44_9MAGN